MSAEAIARLRDPLSRAEAQGSTFVYGALTADLRALLDRLDVLETAFAAARPSLEAEALDALRGVTEAIEASLSGDESVGLPEFPAMSMTEAWERRVTARAVLVKAGRR